MQRITRQSNSPIRRAIEVFSRLQKTYPMESNGSVEVTKKK